MFASISGDYSLNFLDSGTDLHLRILVAQSTTQQIDKSLIPSSSEVHDAIYFGMHSQHESRSDRMGVSFFSDNQTHDQQQRINSCTTHD